MGGSNSVDIQELSKRMQLMQDKQEIEEIQNIYGYYLDNNMWDEAADTFTDNDPSIEIGRRGLYRGKENLRSFLRNVLGTGDWGLGNGHFSNHIQIQFVITVDPSGTAAKCRSRTLTQIRWPDQDFVRWSEGVYENTFSKDAGRWKLKDVWWGPTFYFDSQVKVWFDSTEESQTYPPTAPSHPYDEKLGRIWVPFHYKHPFTGMTVPSPSGTAFSEAGIPIQA